VSGRTNAEIAAALVIGRRTVTTHVERIFDKLEAHTRTEAAARARARALC
jgi:DNA-binding NarL/FixJ family response regulator